MWDDTQRPTSPDILQVTFTPLRHFTVYDAMNAKVTLRLVVQRSQPDSLCEATVENSVRLVDREAARPPLWDLGTSFKGAAFASASSRSTTPRPARCALERVSWERAQVH